MHGELCVYSVYRSTTLPTSAGGGHHAQFRFVRAALHREGDAAPGGKVRGIGELQRLPVLRHGAEAVQQRTAPGGQIQGKNRSIRRVLTVQRAAKLPQRTARPLQAAVTPVPMLYRSSRVDTRRLCR